MVTASRLLIVDDEPGVARQSLGFEVQTIHDSELFEKALG